MIWGLDLGVRSVHMVGIPRSGEMVEPLTFQLEVEKATRWQELSTLSRQFAERVAFTDVVFIEEPPLAGSRNIRTALALAQTCGALLAVSPGKAYVVPVSSWKKDVIGNGSASKDMVSDWLAQYRNDLARRCSDQNLVDASCIAIYGELLLDSARADQ